MQTQTLEKTVGAYEAKTRFAELLDLVESGQSILITRHLRNVARLVPAEPANAALVFNRIRALRSRLGKSQDTHRELIEAGRRI